MASRSETPSSVRKIETNSGTSFGWIVSAHLVDLGQRTGARWWHNGGETLQLAPWAKTQGALEFKLELAINDASQPIIQHRHSRHSSRSGLPRLILDEGLGKGRAKPSGPVRLLRSGDVLYMLHKPREIVETRFVSIWDRAMLHRIPRRVHNASSGRRQSSKEQASTQPSHEPATMPCEVATWQLMPNNEAESVVL